MNITVIGAGNMGASFVKQLSKAGHMVKVTARDLAKAEAVAAQYDNVTAVAGDNAANGADIVITATAYKDAVFALQTAGNLNGKVVIDITNPLTDDFMGLTLGQSTSASEEIAKAIPGARVVKAFNTVFAQVLNGGADFGNGQTVTVFAASDDSEAKADVITLAESMDFQTVDAGPLKNARYLEPLAGLNIYLGYGAGLGTDMAPAWIHKA